MPRWNGGIIGPENAPTELVASGMWSLEEAQVYIEQGLWPSGEALVELTGVEAPASIGEVSVTATIADPYFDQTVLLLHGDGTNGAQNNTFLDSSTNNLTITRNGNTTQGSFSPFSAAAGAWSNYFDGSGDYLDLPASASSQIGTSSFCIEAWVYITSTSNAQFLIGNGSSNGFYWSLRFAGNTIAVGRVGVALDASVSYTFSENTWYHVAVTRDGTSLRFFVDGTQIGATATVSTNWGNFGYRIGSELTTNYFGGFASNIRLVIGSAVYTSNFTPPTDPLTAITNTSLLTCQSNRFKDNSTNNFAITKNGDVKVTSFSPFAPTGSYSAATNGGSGYFDGSGDNLTFTGTSSTVGSGDFTIELWYYPTAFQNFDTLFSNTRGASGFNVGTNASASVSWYSGSTVKVSSGTLQLNAWNHIAFTRTSNILRLYVNGAQTGSTPTVSTDFSATGYVIGDLAPSLSEPANGYISGLRVVTESLASGSTYTVPTAPPTAITNTSFLCNFTNAGIFDNTGKNNLDTVGNAQIDTSVKKYGTGSMEFDGTGDYLLAIGDSNNFVFGTGDFTVEMWINTSTVSPSYQGVWDSRTSDPSVTPHITLASGTPVWWVSGAARITGSALSTSTWYHLAVARSGTSTKMFVNGTQVGSTYTDSNNYVSRAVPTIGINFDTLFPFTGFIDDLRITKGIARYTSSFTPPTEAFPNT